jgi:glycosyltransferase involved in cell wall biosynthesis
LKGILEAGRHPAAHIVFWLNEPSPHLSSWLRAVAASEGVRATVIVECDRSPARQALGFPVPNLSRSKVIVCQDPASIPGLIRDMEGAAVHVIGGMRGTPLAERVLPELARRRTRIGIISEAAGGVGWRGLLRRHLYRREWARFAAAVDFVLAMGSYGVDWFAQCGCSREKLFPFTYVTERHARSELAPAQTGPSSLVYVGRFVARKGLDIFLEALARLQHLDWVLTMIGTGPFEEKLRRLVGARGLSKRVRFMGPLENQAAITEISRSDLLVLPSRHDGWGAVVNEALMEGVPVICSDCCGARDLLAEPWRGEVFAAGSAASLREVLEKWIPTRRTAAVTERIRQWSSCIEGDSLAAYFRAILDSVYGGRPRPTPPWLCPDRENSIGPSSLLKWTDLPEAILS